MNRREFLRKSGHRVGTPATSSILSRAPRVDWILANHGDSSENYQGDPLPAFVRRVIVSDTDHVWGHTCVDNVRVW